MYLCVSIYVCFVWISVSVSWQSLIARFIGPTPTHLGPTGPRWVPCWPHEPCYLGYVILTCIISTIIDWLVTDCGTNYLASFIVWQSLTGHMLCNILFDVQGYHINAYQFILQSGVVTTQSSIKWYCIQNCSDWSRIQIRIWIRKRYPITGEIWDVFSVNFR